MEDRKRPSNKVGYCRKISLQTKGLSALRAVM